MADLILIAIAAFGAGILNTLAGGGTFLTFPALVYVGVPPILANATSAVAVFPGYLAGTFGFRAELSTLERPSMVRLTIITLLGGLAGSLLLLVTPADAFSAIVPFLLLFATLVFLFGPQIRAFAAAKSKGIANEGAVGLFLVAVYGGYFNGGLGIVLLALFALWGWNDLNKMNGLKNWLSFALSAISVATFAVAGLVVWPKAAVMMVFAILGGYLGAPIARAVPASAIRILVATIGFGMSAAFFAGLI